MLPIAPSTSENYINHTQQLNYENYDWLSLITDGQYLWLEGDG